MKVAPDNRSERRDIAREQFLAGRMEQSRGKRSVAWLNSGKKWQFLSALPNESRDPSHSLNFQFCKDYFDDEAVSRVVREYSPNICRGESQSSIYLCSQTSLSVVPLRNSSDLRCFALSRETTDEVYFVVIQ